MGSYIPVDARETEAMLEVLGLDSLDGLYGQVPPEVLIDRLDIAGGVSELEALGHMEGLAAQDVRFTGIFRGAGAYRHYLPAIVKTVTSK